MPPNQFDMRCYSYHMPIENGKDSRLIIQVEDKTYKYHILDDFDQETSSRTARNQPEITHNFLK